MTSGPSENPELGGAGSSTLVAGVSGTLGRAIARRLAAEGWAVSGISRGPGEFVEAGALAAAVPGVDLQYGDLSDASVAAKACVGVESVTFAAGSSGVAASFDDAPANLLGNALPWLNLLTASPWGTRLVLLSSQLVYGPPRERPFQEQDFPQPASPYAIHRTLLEAYGRLFAPRRGLEVVALRLGNVFGDVFATGRPRTHGVVPRLLSDLVNEGVARLYGDGVQQIDLLHGDDLGRAVAAVLRAPIEVGKFSIFNVSGVRVTVREVAEALRDGLGSGTVTSVEWDPSLRWSLARDVRLDDSAFRRRYGWFPCREVREELRKLGSRWRPSHDAESMG